MGWGEPTKAGHSAQAVEVLAGALVAHVGAERAPHVAFDVFSDLHDAGLRIVDRDR